MKINRRPILAIIPAAALAGSMLTAPVAGAQSSLPIPEDLLGSASGSLDLGSLGGDPCGEKVVTPNNMGGWDTPDDENEAKIVASADVDVEVFGSGVLEMKPDASQGTSLYKDAKNVPVSSLLDENGAAKPISYQYKGEGQAPALQIRVLGANVVKDPTKTEAPFEKTTDGFATIVWSPADGTAAWQEAEATESEDFWVSRTILKDPEGLDDKGELTDGNDILLKRGERTTLEEIVDILGEQAVISAYGVQQTKDNKTPTTQVDDFVFGCETTDFEVDSKETAPVGPDFGSLALGGGLALAAALAVGGGAFAIQNGMIQLPPELAALLPA